MMQKRLLFLAIVIPAILITYWVYMTSPPAVEEPVPSEQLEPIVQE